MLSSAMNLVSLVDSNNAFIITNGVLTGLSHSVDGTVVIPEGVEEICMDAFRDEKLTRVVFPSTLRVIGKGAFRHCEQLVSISFAGNAHISTIREEAFLQCTSLAEVELPDSLELLGKRAFSAGVLMAPNTKSISMIQELYIPAHTIVSSRCFEGTCINLLHIRTSLLEESAFAGSHVTRVSWETRCKCIPRAAFNRCRRLCEFKFAEDALVDIIESQAFSECTSLSSIDLPEGVTTLMDSCFYMSGLQYFKAPHSLKRIGRDAFASTSISTMDLADAELTAIGSYAFSGTKISDLVVRGNIPVLDFSIVSDCFQLVRLVVGPAVGDLIDIDRVSSRLFSNLSMHYELAVILEGIHTRCDILVPTIFIPRGSVIDITKYRHVEPPSIEKMKGMEDAYGRYPETSRNFIYY